jgi:Zn-dependent protease with chaperone function
MIFAVDMRRLAILFSIVLAVAATSGAYGQESNPQALTTLTDSPLTAREQLLFVLQYNSPDLVHRYPGAKIFLDEVYGPDPLKAEFLKKLAAIAKRLDMDTPEVLIVEPALDRQGNPKPQKPDSSIGWANGVKGRHYNIIFVTKYLKDGLTHAQLLSVLAHETGHFPQFKKDGGKETPHGAKLERQADAFALSCPEVDPNDFKSMLIQVDKLQDEAARKHPLLYDDFTGGTKVIPASVQTRMLFGGDHPTTKARIKEADKEIRRRAAITAGAVPVP